MNIKERLVEKYSEMSKHSNYQILPPVLDELIGNEIQVKSRYEKERLAYITSKIPVKGKTFIDIGGNTGYFSIELLQEGAKKVRYFEGNKEHADFVSLAAEFLNLGEKLKITSEYFQFNEKYTEKYDTILLLNVLHHFGDDYGPSDANILMAKTKMIESLNVLSTVCDNLVFQLGFNWKGDRNASLFDNGTKEEMIKFIKGGTKDNWDIPFIGVPEKVNEGIIYRDLNNSNLQRNDSLGEFLNRPIFIMESKKK